MGSIFYNCTAGYTTAPALLAQRVRMIGQLLSVGEPGRAVPLAPRFRGIVG